MPDLESLKHAPAELGLNDLIASRWSPRAYSDKPVSSADLEKIFTAAGWAASSGNEQPWRFLVGRQGDDTFAKILDALVEGNKGWAGKVPVLVLSVGQTTSSAGKPNPYALHDTGAASATMSLQATALGLHTHGMGGFDKARARALFEIPADYELGACWAIGYLGDPDTLPEGLRLRETATRTRKTLEEYVFSAWETPAQF